MEKWHRMQTRLWLKRAIISFICSVFIGARADAQLLMPVVSVSPSTTNVSNGDTVTLNGSAYYALGALTSIKWQYNGGALPTNATYTTSGGILNINSSIESTLTVRGISTKNAGTYTMTASAAGGILGLLSSSAQATVSVTPTVLAVTGGSGMVGKGFKFQFSAPTGSNLVIEASTDFKTWKPICTNIVSNGSVTYTDAVAKTYAHCYYRAYLK